MENQTIIQAVEHWQKNFLVHPLTCGNDSNHQTLTTEVKDGQVVLVCLDCSYTQTFIPQIVLDSYPYHK